MPSLRMRMSARTRYVVTGSKDPFHSETEQFLVHSETEQILDITHHARTWGARRMKKKKVRHPLQYCTWYS
jgi:hypothetical protein